MVGTTAAIILGVASAASSVANAKIQKNAANKAADTQVVASTKAADIQQKAAADTLAFQKEQWAAAQQNAAPFVQLGQGAAKRLSDWFGMPAGAADAPAMTTAPAPSTPMPGTAVPRNPNGAMPLSSFTGRTNTMTQVPPSAAAVPPSAQAMTAPGAPQANATGYVTMRSPDGKTTKAIPRSQVAHYESLGATQVGQVAA